MIERNKVSETNPLVSVIITTFNMVASIENALFSILNQTYKNLEVLVIDDASNDNTLALLKCIEDPRLRVYKNAINCGTYYGKNYGLMQCQGDYITFQDADDFSDPYRIEKCLAQFTVKSDLKLTRVSYLRYKRDTHQLWWRSYMQAVQTLFFKKELLQEIGFFDKARHSADTEYLKRATRHYGLKKIDVINEFLYFAQVNNTGITGTTTLSSQQRRDYAIAYQEQHKNKSELYKDFEYNATVLSGQPKENLKWPDTPLVQLVHKPNKQSSYTKEKAFACFKSTSNLINNFQQQILLRLA